MASSGAGRLPRIEINHRHDLLCHCRAIGLIELAFIAQGRFPALCLITEADAHQVALLGLGVFERLSSVEKSKVVDELDVPDLTVDLDTHLLGKVVDSVESTLHVGGEIFGVYDEWCPDELGDDFAVAFEDYRAGNWVAMRIPSLAFQRVFIKGDHDVRSTYSGAGGQTQSLARISRTEGSVSMSLL